MKKIKLYKDQWRLIFLGWDELRIGYSSKANQLFTMYLHRLNGNDIQIIEREQNITKYSCHLLGNFLDVFTPADMHIISIY